VNALELSGIVKRFGPLTALDGVSLAVAAGEVLGLVGENGAGKSTLVSVACGLYSADSGTVRAYGRELPPGDPRAAIDAGLGVVYQHFMLVPPLTVWENVTYAKEPRRGVFIDRRAARRRVVDLGMRHHLEVYPDAAVAGLSVGVRQRVEILKALYRGAEILILDEPTAVLTPQEATELFGIIKSLRADGKSIIFISHKLNEVLEIADRITVLRRGKQIETVPREGATEASLARAMVGRDVLLRVEKPKAEVGDTLLEVDDLHVLDDRGIEKVRGVSFAVRAGEIVGIAGVDGNGQSELIDAIAGLRKRERGAIRIAGRALEHANARQMLDAGLGHIPEDRQLRGLVLEFSIAENIALHDYAEPPDARWGWLFPARLVERARKLIREFDVRGGGPLTRAGTLSGGNQQKVVAAREIARDPKVLIAAQPTRGLDVGAIEFLHQRLVEERGEGRAILLVSLELDEILSLSDRILVLYEGEIVGEHGASVSEEEIGLEMLGGRRSAA